VINEARLIQLFLDLCNINSPSRQEQEVVEWMKGFLTQNDLHWTEDNATSISARRVAPNIMP
jgi:di/tripeptidase